jgi:hypothetical protein
MISVMKRSVFCSIPLAQAITGVAGATRKFMAAVRRSCAGTASRTAAGWWSSAAAMCTRGSMVISGSRGLARRAAMAAAAALSRATTVTVHPARAATLASATPHAPAPTTAMRSKFMI